MKLALIIYYVSTVAWVFPMFRQYKSDLFYFFLFLGLCDPLSIIAGKVLSLPGETLAVIFAPILFYTINVDRKKPFKISKLEIFVFVLAYSLIFLIDNLNIIILLIHTLVAIRAIYRIIIDLHYKQKINIIRVVLAFYMITSVASHVVFLNEEYQGWILFYTNLAFQVLIAIFFSIFSENNPKMNIQLVQSAEN
jgi:hypothetical protein